MGRGVTRSGFLETMRTAMTRRTRVAELLTLMLLGLFLAALEAFETGGLSPPLRYLYWQMALIGGGAIAAVIEVFLARRLGTRPLLFAVAQLVAMTPPIAAWVAVIPVVIFGPRADAESFLTLLPAVMIVNIVVIGLIVLTRRLLSPKPRPAPSEGLAPERIRARLTPRLARSRLLAIQAEDHYLRIRTDAGSALILMRFADALEALEGTDGFRVHRSWWVARIAVETVRWKSGRGELTLSDGAVVPVSRTYTGTLRETDWSVPVA